MRTTDMLTVGGALIARRVIGLCIAALEVVAFWLAVLLPALYLPVLAAAGVGVIDPAPVLSLIGLHLVALVVGHRHAPISGWSGASEGPRHDSTK